MQNKVLEQKIVNFLALGSGIVLLVWISMNITKDADFLKNGKRCKAIVDTKTSGLNPYSIVYTFYDEFAQKQRTVVDGIDGRMEKRIETENDMDIEIAYTSSRIYYVEKGMPTMFMFIFRSFIWIIILIYTIYGIICLLKRRPIVAIK